MNNEILNHTAWSKIVSVSDEAFILLAWENYWNVWVPDPLKIKKVAWPQGKAAWSMAAHGKDWKIYGGWNPVAIAHYHQLYKDVERDQNDDKQNEQFDNAMLEEMKKHLSKKKQQQLRQHNQPSCYWWIPWMACIRNQSTKLLVKNPTKSKTTY